MNLLRRVNRPLSSERFDAHFGQLTSFGVALLVLVLGFRKLTLLQMTEAEAFFGVLLVLAVAMLAVVIGILVGIRATVESGTLRQRSPEK